LEGEGKNTNIVGDTKRWMKKERCEGRVKDNLLRHQLSPVRRLTVTEGGMRPEWTR